MMNVRLRVEFSILFILILFWVMIYDSQSEMNASSRNSWAVFFLDSQHKFLDLNFVEICKIGEHEKRMKNDTNIVFSTSSRIF